MLANNRASQKIEGFAVFCFLTRFRKTRHRHNKNDHY